jgi:Protein of unknown function (DUF3383)
MQPSIPAAMFADVIPSVLAAGAADLAMNAVFVDNTGDTSIPIGTVMKFASDQAVDNWYGPNSVQAALAAIYFAGYNGATALPPALFFVQYNNAAVPAYLRGGSLAGLTLTQLQAFSGVITIAINGETVVSANINLAGATSFSNAAALIQAGLDVTGGTFTGTGSQALGVLTIASTVSGQLHVGDVVTGAGVSGGTATILSFGTYTPISGVGTVNVSTSGSTSVGAVDVSSTASCTYDALRQAFVITSPTTGAASTIAFPTTDAFVTNLLLTSAKGAVLSQGAAAATPASVMTQVTTQTMDWATFMTLVDPDAGAVGGPIKVQFATWNAAQNAAFMYVAYDSDPNPSTATNDAACFAALVASLVGTFPLWSATQGPQNAAFVCGLTAAINFNQPGGRTTYAFRSSPVVVPDVTSQQIAATLGGATPSDLGNGYNYYGGFATRTTAFNWLQRGRVTGGWNWADSYVNQIYWNAKFQNDLAELETQLPAIPYTQIGYNDIHQALAPDIAAMGAFGAWVAGVALSGTQALAVNTAAGLNIAPVLQSQGWYLQVEDPGSTVRGERGSPIITFWYSDGGSIQQLNLSSVDVE